MGADPGSLRVFEDEQARRDNHKLGSSAFAYGNEIHIGDSRYDSSERSGQQLFAHEVTHTIEQAHSGPRVQGGKLKKDEPLPPESPGAPNVADLDYLSPGKIEIDTRAAMDPFYIQRISAYRTVLDTFWDRTITEWKYSGKFDPANNRDLVAEIKANAYQIRDAFEPTWQKFLEAQTLAEDAELAFIAQLDNWWVRWNEDYRRTWTDTKGILENLPAAPGDKSSYKWHMDKIEKQRAYADNIESFDPAKAEKIKAGAAEREGRFAERHEDMSAANRAISLANYNLDVLLEKPISNYLTAFIKMKSAELDVAKARDAAAAVGFSFTLKHKTIKSRARHKDPFVRRVLTETVQEKLDERELPEEMPAISMAKEKRLLSYKQAKREKPAINANTIAAYFKQKFVDPMLATQDAEELEQLLNDLASRYPHLFPDYFMFLMEDLAGLTYYTAQNQWRDPVALVSLIVKDQIARTPDGIATAAKRSNLALIEERLASLTISEALAFLVKMHDKGQIPDFAWAFIVSSTDLKLVAKHREEVLSYKPDKPFFLEPVTILNFNESRLKAFAGSDPEWDRIFTSWRSSRRSDANGWFAQLMATLEDQGGAHRPRELTTTSAVCNQVAEAAAAYRTGKKLFGRGGLRSNAAYYADAGRLKPYSSNNAHKLLRPGNSIFWMKWTSKKPYLANSVDYRKNINYPMYHRAETIDIASCQAEQKKAKKQGKFPTCEPGGRILYDSFPFKNTKKHGPVTDAETLACRARSGSIPCGLVRQEVKPNLDTLEDSSNNLYLGWAHQATVIWSPYEGRGGTRILTFETEGNKGPSHVAPQVRTLAELNEKAPLIRIGVDQNPGAPQDKVGMTPEEAEAMGMTFGEEQVQMCQAEYSYDDSVGACFDDSNYTPLEGSPFALEDETCGGPSADDGKMCSAFEDIGICEL